MVLSLVDQRPLGALVCVGIHVCLNRIVIITDTVALALLLLLWLAAPVDHRAHRQGAALADVVVLLVLPRLKSASHRVDRVRTAIIYHGLLWARVHVEIV